MDKLLKQVANKLKAEGLHRDNYSKEKASAILNRCVAPVMLNRLLNDFQHCIKALVTQGRN